VKQDDIVEKLALLYMLTYPIPRPPVGDISVESFVKKYIDVKADIAAELNAASEQDM